MSRGIILFVVNEAYFFVSHRLEIAKKTSAAGFDVHLAAPPDHVWAPDGFTTDELAAHGITFHPVSLSRRGQNPIQEAATFFSILRLILRLRPAIVHLLTIKPNLYGGIAARLASTPAVVYAFTGLGQLYAASGALASLRKSFVLRILKASLNHANSVAIFQNTEDCSEFVRLGLVERESTETIEGAGVDLRAFSPHPEPHGTPIVILPARLIWEKGVQEFVDAARLLRERGIAATFALVGDSKASNPRAVPQSSLQAWREEGIVEIWGRQDDMPSVFARSHIVCLPSRYGEGVPKVLLEAAACGRPVIATDIRGCRQVVEQGRTGLLVPKGDPARLADAITTLIERPALRNEYGTRARELAVSRFDVREVASQTLAIYDRLLPD